MDSLTGRRRRQDFSDSLDTSSPTKSNNPSTSTKEFIPDLYKSVTSKKFRVEHPSTEEEREFMRNLPCDTESALLHLRSILPPPVGIIPSKRRLPPIFLYSQLSAIISNQFTIDTQLSKLARDNKILTFSTFTSTNYLIVFLDDFLRIEREGVFSRFVKEVVTSTDSEEDEVLQVKRSLENSKYFSKQSLRSKWKFEEDEIRQLVNSGYLGIQEGGVYCMSLPGAGEFIKAFEKGRKAVLGAVKRAKFGEILQNELEQRPMKKSAPLGVLYHIYDLIGSGEIDKVDTTSGPLLRAKRKPLDE